MARLLTASLLLALLGCEGNIGEPTTDRPPTTGNPSDDYCARLDPEPGFVTLHRLNRLEMDRTFAALFGDDVGQPATDALPGENESHSGFVNDADVLTIGPVAVEALDGVLASLAETYVPQPAFRSRYLGSCDPDTDGTEACAGAFADAFLPRAWRRPIATTERDAFVALVVAAADGRTFDFALQNGIRSALLAPSFLFRPETHGMGIRELDGYELASRLSFALWASMPDDELFELAEAGALNEDATIRSQMDRMIADPRFDAFLDEFATRWLKVVKLDYTSPDPDLFSEFDGALRDAMTQETRLFIRHVIEENLPLSSLVVADFTYLNERLASHYGIEGVSGDEMRLVRLPEGTHRGGLLTQGSILTVTSQPNRTSPVKRGEYLLERMLCAPPPAPPNNVEALNENSMDPDGTVVNLRERLAQHRENPECATCHDVMDPLGFALEAFDAVGAFREVDETGAPIDSLGELPDGRSFDGPHELGAFLAEDHRFAACVGEHLLAYTLGRSLSGGDLCVVDRIVERANAQDGTLRTLLAETLLDEVFRSVGTNDESTEVGR
ncbi:MAG: DUF1592 domain-containing protein [Polyangiales bacterium]|nr:DUF1592 domain-containing protein [Myxococcales bacterium]